MGSDDIGIGCFQEYKEILIVPFVHFIFFKKLMSNTLMTRVD